ncbi:MAG: DUF4158 domain-containing protein [Verrucomicrobia bacterium]|nr:DUF4158 domain-containing protein [Verrucomicrobiota bacterium]
MFDPPTDVRSIVRHYTFSTEDLTLIRQRRRNANRLGFAVHRAYLRFPGRVLGPKETPPTYMLSVRFRTDSAMTPVGRNMEKKERNRVKPEN